MSHAFDSKALALSRQVMGLIETPMHEAQLQAKIQNLFIDAMKFAAPAEQTEQLSGNTEQVSQPVLPATQFKPVADLYGIAVPGGRSTSYSTDAAEASDCRVMGWDVQEFVKLERLQEAITGNYPAIPDGYALVPVEPTKEMMLHKSGCQRHAWDDADCPMRQTRRLVWSRMIEAVPKQEAQEVKK